MIQHQDLNWFCSHQGKLCSSCPSTGALQMHDPWEGRCWINWKPPQHNPSPREANSSPALRIVFSLTPGRGELKPSQPRLICLSLGGGKPQNETLKPSYAG